MSKNKDKTTAPADRRFTQIAVPEPSFRRGIASIVDIRGSLFVVCPAAGRRRFKGIASEQLRADSARLATERKALRFQPTVRRHEMGQRTADVEVAPEL